MKNIIILVVIMSGLTVGGLATYSQSQEVLVEKEIVHVETMPEWADNEEAVEAAQNVIRKQELEDQQQELVEEISSLQDQLDTVRDELESL